MYLYKNRETQQFIVSEKEITRDGFILIREFREVQINSANIGCSMYFISDDGENNNILMISQL